MKRVLYGTNNQSFENMGCWLSTLVSECRLDLCSVCAFYHNTPVLFKIEVDSTGACTHSVTAKAFVVYIHFSGVRCVLQVKATFMLRSFILCPYYYLKSRGQKVILDSNIFQNQLSKVLSLVSSNFKNSSYMF